MTDCIFCKIVAGEISAEKIWEDDQYLAVLDAFPVCEGQTLVLAKVHQPSYVFNLDDAAVTSVYLAAKRVAKLLDKSLATSRCLQVMEGLGVDHLHLKLYPLTKELEKEGLIAHIGGKAEEAKLKEVAIKIKKGGII